jgi:hypothetical protein
MVEMIEPYEGKILILGSGGMFGCNEVLRISWR